MNRVPTWWLFLTLDQDWTTPREVECGIAGKRRHYRFEPGTSLEAWFRPQYDSIKAAGVLSAPCGVMMPSQIHLHEARSLLLQILGKSLPAVGWHPTYLWLNTRGYSDRGEPPDPSTSMRVHGEVRLPVFGWLEKVQFQSTVSMLQPMDADAWRALLGSLARELGLRIDEI